jgi:uncharacterized protein involved in outer membrane biogenesis
LRDLLTILAGVLVVALTAALVGPYLIDWTAERGVVEAQLSRALGARVRVDGAVSLALLPTPSLSVGDLSVASPAPGGPSLTAVHADFELNVAPLMRGEIQFMRADLDRPTLQLSLGPDGALTLPNAPSELPQRIDFDQIRLRDATLIMRRPGADGVWTLPHVDIEAHAASLDGPFNGEGSLAQGAWSFRFEAGARNGDAIPLQASLSESGRGAPTAQFDGAILIKAAGAATRLAYQGSVSSTGSAALAGLPSLAWRVDGPLRVDAFGASLNGAALQLGPDAAAVAMKLNAQAGFQPQSPISLSGVAQQIDAGRFLQGLGPAAGHKLVDALTRAVSDGSLFSGAARPLALSFSAQAIALGGDALTGTNLRLREKPGAPIELSGQSQGPGDSHLDWSGSLETGPAAVFRGRLDVGAEDVEAFADWLAPAVPYAATRLKSTPFQALAAQADVDVSDAGFDARNLTLTADRTVLRGSAAYTRAIGSQRARLYADLRSNSLDLDSLPNLAGAATVAQGADLALSLDARAVRLAHFGQGMIDAGRIVVSLERTGDRLALHKLSLQDLGGANLTAAGAADDKSARLDATLDASRLDELSALVTRVAPGPFAEALTERAVALSPARLSIDMNAARAPDGRYRSLSFSLKGSARGADVSGALTPDGADPKRMNLAFDLQGPDSAILLRQLGAQTLPIADTGPGRIQMRAHSRANGDLEGSAAASLAGSDLSFVGDVSDWMNAPTANGRFSFRSEDAAPFLQLMTFVLPDPTQSLPISIAATASAKAGAFSLTNIAGALDGDRVSGAANFAPSAQQGLRLQGSLAFDSLSLPALAGLILGPPAPPPAGALWASAKFAPGLPAPPATDLSLSAQTFELAPGWSGTNASTRLNLGAGLISLENMRMQLGTGTLSGSLDLHRDNQNVAATARVKLQDAPFDQPFFSGLISGEANFASTGSSPMELVDGLAGGGAFAASHVRVARTDAGALSRLLAMSDQANFKVDAASVEAALAGELDKGPLAIDSCALDLETAGGMLRLASAPQTAAPQARAALSLAVDLRDLAIEERVRLEAKSPPSDWPEATPPSFTAVWRAPAPGEAAKRTIEADSLIGDLSTRAAGREAQRISALEFDIQERAFFERRLEGLEFMHRREAEVAAWQAEQKRAAEAEAGDKTKRAEPDAVPALIAPPPAPPQPPAGLSQDPLSLGRF